jgi:very-short-patch-repair endonuclease
MADECGITHLLCGQTHVRAAGSSDDEVIAALASRQLGIAGRPQLLELRMSSRAIDYRVACGRLRPIYPGVYAVGHDAVPYAGRALAAATIAQAGRLGARPIAGASHLTAAYLWGIVDTPTHPIHVTATEHREHRSGLVIHRAVLPASEVKLLDGIPITSVARTILDLSATTPERRLRRMIREAEFRQLATIADLAAILERHPRRRGRRLLAELVARSDLRAGRTRSDLEDDFLEFCARRGLPLPETNVQMTVRGVRVEPDCLWRAERVILELDGYEGHGGKAAFEADRARDRALAAAGWLPTRATWAQVHFDGDALESELRDLLAARRLSPGAA